jgi:vacuolar protein sorting-associated protein VTA1
MLSEHFKLTIKQLGKLYAVEQILKHGLHSDDDSVASFAMELLDEIEALKSGDDVILQEVIGDQETSIAYVMNFANKVFATAKLQIQDHKSGRQTAMSLLASVNFFDLLKLWPDEASRLEETEEVSKKVKYAKYHAARILKALKSGEDPNEYESAAAKEEPERNELVDKTSNENEDGDEEDESTQTDELGLPSTPKTISKEDIPPPFVDDVPESSLVLPSTPSSNPTAEFSLPQPPKSLPETPRVVLSKTALESLPPKPQLRKDINVQKIMESSEVYAKAQKHAKFAISAMNYEDKVTAINELEEAIRMLGQLKDEDL